MEYVSWGEVCETRRITGYLGAPSSDKTQGQENVPSEFLPHIQPRGGAVWLSCISPNKTPEQFLECRSSQQASPHLCIRIKLLAAADGNVEGECVFTSLSRQMV